MSVKKVKCNKEELLLILYNFVEDCGGVGWSSEFDDIV